MKSPALKSKLITVIGIVFLLSCGKETSQMTGWSYNDPKKVTLKLCSCIGISKFSHELHEFSHELHEFHKIILL